MGDRSPAGEVFTDFQDNAGWGSIGTACFVSISGPVITIIGSDSAVHLAEELKDAARQLPKAMLCMAFTNYFLGFVMLLAFVFVVGNVEEVLATPTGQPYIQVIWNATQSSGPTIALVAIIIFFFLFTAVNVNTTASRQIWAFARDGGLPFSPWINYVCPTQARISELFLNQLLTHVPRSHHTCTSPSTPYSCPGSSAAASPLSPSAPTPPSSTSKPSATAVSSAPISSASLAVSTTATPSASMAPLSNARFFAWEKSRVTSSIVSRFASLSSFSWLACFLLRQIQRLRR